MVKFIGAKSAVGLSPDRNSSPRWLFATVPAVFENRQFTIAGGLMSYGSSLTDTYRLAGVYIARIQRGKA